MFGLPKKFETEIIKNMSSINRFDSYDRMGPEQKIRIFDPSNGSTWGYLVIDNTSRGPAVGGIRIAKNIDLIEMGRLAYSMTLKNSAACLPFGGGKVGLNIDASLLNKEPIIKFDLMNLLAEALFPFNNYISAPDMGTNENDIQNIYEYNSKMLKTKLHNRGGLGTHEKHDGIPIDGWELTAYGLFTAINSIENFGYGIKLNGARVVIQGYGNVGGPIATKLHSKGSIIVGVSDINTGLWNSGGLDVAQLNKIRNIKGGLSNYNGKIEKRFNSKQLDWLLEAPCEILIPSARPDSITARNADRIQCKVILQGANAPVNKVTEYYLSNRRKILSLSDFIVNSGGIIGCGVEFSMKTNMNYKNTVEKFGVRRYTENLIHKTISENIKEILSELMIKKKPDVFFRESALALAHKRLQDTKLNWL